MKVLLINGSPRSEGCTYTGLCIIKEQFAKNGVDSEIYQVGNKPIVGCTACMSCRQTGKCAFNDDLVNTVAEEFRKADGIILGSAVHYASASGAATSFFDRLFYSVGTEHTRLKFGASIVSCRSSGASATLDQLNKYFTITQMPIVSACPPLGIKGHTPEEVYKDEEVVRTLQILANNMAYLIKCKAQSNVPIPEEPPRAMTNSIR
jgi:multimeric flavodoxin WrbA